MKRLLTNCPILQAACLLAFSISANAADTPLPPMPGSGGVPLPPVAIAPDSVSKNLVPIYRFLHRNTGEHFFTDKKDEVTDAQGWNSEGVGFNVTPDKGDNLVTIYRCLIPGNSMHFISLDSNCEGQKLEAPYGQIYKESVAGTSPLVRMYNGTNGDHLETRNLDEVASAIKLGYRIESILGYAPD